MALWLADTEGAKFWLSVLTELRNRGVEDILIACVDGLKGFPEAIASEYPQTQVQLCIVHMVRNSLRYVSWKDYKAVSAELKTIYQASTEELALQQLDSLEKSWGEQYPQIIKSWRDNWENVATLRSENLCLSDQQISEFIPVIHLLVNRIKFGFIEFAPFFILTRFISDHKLLEMRIQQGLFYLVVTTRSSKAVWPKFHHDSTGVL